MESEVQGLKVQIWSSKCVSFVCGLYVGAYRCLGLGHTHDPHRASAPALAASAAQAAAPVGQVQRLDNALIDVMQNADQLKFQGRYDKLPRW